MVRRVIAFILLGLLVTGGLACGGHTAVLPSEAARDKWEKFGRQGEEAKAQQWQEDLRFMVDELSRRHKNMYFSVPQSEYIKMVDELKAKIPALDDNGRLVEFMRLAARIGDAHTGVSLDLPLHWFPLYLKVYNDGIYAVGAAKEYEAVLGKRLVKIGGKDIDAVYRDLSGIIPHENAMQVKNGFSTAARCAEALQYYGYISGLDVGNFTFAGGDGKLTDITVRTSNPEEEVELVTLSDRLAGKAPLYRQHPEKNYWYEYLEAEKTVYFQYNRCQEDKTLPLKGFIRDLLAFIDKNDVDYFVFDLRGNGGGNSSLIEPLIDGLAARPQINRPGHLYGVVGRATFSSAILNAIKLRNETKAVIIGEPTGGRPNHYGEVKAFNLPNTGLRVSYSTKYFHEAKEDTDSLYPDITVELSFAADAAGTDPVLEKILSLR